MRRKLLGITLKDYVPDHAGKKDKERTMVKDVLQKWADYVAQMSDNTSRSRATVLRPRIGFEGEEGHRRDEEVMYLWERVAHSAIEGLLSQDEWTDGRMDGRTDQRTDGRTCRRTDEPRNGRTNVRTKE